MLFNNVTVNRIRLQYRGNRKLYRLFANTGKKATQLKKKKTMKCYFYIQINIRFICFVAAIQHISGSLRRCYMYMYMISHVN